MKKNELKQFIACLLVLVLIAGLLAGCVDSGSDPTGSSSPSTDPSGSSEPTEPSTEPTEPTTEPTEPTTKPTEPTTEPTHPTTAPTEPSTKPTEPTSPGITWQPVNETVYAISAVNVRSGPGISYDKVGQLSQDEAVQRIAKGSNGWSRVVYKGQEAYVSTNYLTTQKPIAPTQPTNPSTPQTDKVIYLTFDDGPGPRTPELLAILEKYNVKVTFFVMGDSNLEYLDDIAKAGHAIGIHTYSHKYDVIYKSTDAFWDDFYKMDNIIYQRTGIHTNLHRFPGGSSNSVSIKHCPGIITKLAKEVQDKGYYYFDWNVDSRDAETATKTADQVYNNVISTLKKKGHSVVLMHDVKSFTIDAVERIIQWGLQNGYTFEAIDENTPVTHHTIKN